MSDDMSVLKQNYLATELRKVATDSGVDGFVTVQARQALVENDDLLEGTKRVIHERRSCDLNKTIDYESEEKKEHCHTKKRQKQST